MRKFKTLGMIFLAAMLGPAFPAMAGDPYIRLVDAKQGFEKMNLPVQLSPGCSLISVEYESSQKKMGGDHQAQDQVPGLVEPHEKLILHLETSRGLESIEVWSPFLMAEGARYEGYSGILYQSKTIRRVDPRSTEPSLGDIFTKLIVFTTAQGRLEALDYVEAEYQSTEIEGHWLDSLPERSEEGSLVPSEFESRYRVTTQFKDAFRRTREVLCRSDRIIPKGDFFHSPENQ